MRARVHRFDLPPVRYVSEEPDKAATRLETYDDEWNRDRKSREALLIEAKRLASEPVLGMLPGEIKATRLVRRSWDKVARSPVRKVRRWRKARRDSKIAAAVEG